MKKNNSKKHHYLPRHYLNGFTDSKNRFFVYDKQTNKIIQTTPSATFFENNLNTITYPNGSNEDLLEDIYTDIENRCWVSFDKIRASNYKTPIELLDKMHLFYFLLFLHWRLPSNIKFVEQLSEKLFLDNNQLDYFKLKQKSGEKVPGDVIKKINRSLAFKKFTKIVAPEAPFFKDKDWAAKLENWRFFYTGDEKNWFIVGDNPIVTRGIQDHDPVYCLEEFIFPVSGKILLVNINPPIDKSLSPKSVLECNIAIIERAQRFVACQNKDFLEALIKLYKVDIQLG
ncbi:MAG: DUF4238 domain-containing protein, partial [candidate division WOR-3 bacterium]|nr:DUF4238 domain-containing protein [candidate division WOR-3 bacterium]